MARRVVCGALAVVVVTATLVLSSCDSSLRDQIELFVSVKQSGIVYVHGASGDDSNPGSQELPKKTIQNAIDLAAALMDTGEVRVAEGTYIVNETLVVREGISILGGFQISDWARDINAYATVIRGSGIETVIKPEADVTAATVIEGFTIQAAYSAYAACIWCENASPTILRNFLEASQGSTDTVGIFNSSGAPVILSNTINAGDGTASAWGIANSGSPAKILSNVIYGTGSSGTFKGIFNNNSDAVIQNNTIRCGLSADDVGIYNTGSNCIIENNILFSTASSCGIDEVGSDALPVRVNNNDFHGCSPFYDYDSDSCTAVAQLQTYLPVGTASGNMESDPLFVGGMDWHLQGGSPLKGAGLDLSPSFERDRDWTKRTDPWSIGAYEKD
jgi:hypothetical protein